MGIEQLTHEFGTDPHLLQPGFGELLEFIDLQIDGKRWFDTINLDQFISRGEYKRIGVVRIESSSSIGSEDVTSEDICKYIFEVFSTHLKHINLVKFSFCNRNKLRVRSKHVSLKDEGEQSSSDEQYIQLVREQRQYILDLHQQLHALMESNK